MHGRVKVKTSAEQQEAKAKERAKKLHLYQVGQKRALEKRMNREFDAEALELTGQLLLANPDMYTIWNFRKEIFLVFKEEKEKNELQTAMLNELSFTENCLRTNPKSYGSWNHRVWILNEMPDPDWQRELHLCNKYLEMDERNFHCWDYRRFVVKKANVSAEKELEFTDSKIEANFSNYSSWFYRSKLLPRIYPDIEGLRPISEEKLLKEFELVQNAEFTDPNDQSAWFYHRWLLGRGEQKLTLNYFHVKKTNEIILVFNKPLPLSDIIPITEVTVNGNVFDVHWSLPLGLLHSSHVMLGNFVNDDCLKSEKDLEITVKVIAKENVSVLSLQLGRENLESQSENKGRSKKFCMELSATAASVLEQEIESCVQLQELEPDCKWPLLTSILLTRSLDFATYFDKIDEYFERLVILDPLRRGYYDDLRSRFIVENHLENLKIHSLELNLSGKRLTCLRHTEFLVHLKKLDVSNNCLASVNGLEYLQDVEVLILDSNLLITCIGFESLNKLKHLSLRNNLINCLDSVKRLVEKKSSLTQVFLEGNPICELDEYKSIQF